MKTLTIFCFLFAFLAFGQKAEKMEPRAATQAWAAVPNLPENTPSISGGGLIVESEINGVGRKVWLSISQPGSYLMQGRSCDGETTRLGELYSEPNPYGPSNTMIFDSVAMAQALPFSSLSQMCSLEVIHLDKGRMERSLVDTNPWQPRFTPGFQVGSETIIGGFYQISIARLPDDAIVILGRGPTGKVATTPFGSTVSFSPAYLPPPGPTTLTVCSGGRCTTTTFERRLAVEPSPPGVPKG